MQVPGEVSVFVAEPCSLIVDRLDALSCEYADLSIVGHETMGRAVASSVSRSKPTVVLVADRFPDTNGIDVCSRVHRIVPDAAVILVTSRQDDAALLRAVEVGVCGVLWPLAPDDDLVSTVLRAADGEFVIPRQTIQRLFELGRSLRALEDALEGAGMVDHA